MCRCKVVYFWRIGKVNFLVQLRKRNWNLCRSSLKTLCDANVHSRFQRVHSPKLLKTNIQDDWSHSDERWLYLSIFTTTLIHFSWRKYVFNLGVKSLTWVIDNARVQEEVWLNSMMSVICRTPVMGTIVRPTKAAWTDSAPKATSADVWQGSLGITARKVGYLTTSPWVLPHLLIIHECERDKNRGGSVVIPKTKWYLLPSCQALGILRMEWGSWHAELPVD